MSNECHSECHTVEEQFTTRLQKWIGKFPVVIFECTEKSIGPCDCYYVSATCQIKPFVTWVMRQFLHLRHMISSFLERANTEVVPEPIIKLFDELDEEISKLINDELTLRPTVPIPNTIDANSVKFVSSIITKQLTDSIKPKIKNDLVLSANHVSEILGIPLETSDDDDLMTLQEITNEFNVKHCTELTTRQVASILLKGVKGVRKNVNGSKTMYYPRPETL